MRTLQIIGLVIIALGAITTYCSTYMARKFFRIEEAKNSKQSLILKGVGFVLALVGLFLLTQF